MEDMTLPCEICLSYTCDECKLCKSVCMPVALLSNNDIEVAAEELFFKDEKLKNAFILGMLRAQDAIINRLQEGNCRALFDGKECGLSRNHPYHTCANLNHPLNLSYCHFFMAPPLWLRKKEERAKNAR